MCTGPDKCLFIDVETLIGLFHVVNNAILYAKIFYC